MKENNSRVKKSATNVFFGILCQVVITLLSFITRTVFIKTLGAEYLGVNGLFTNILSVLSIMDLGFDTALIYSLYKPLAEGNKEKISALMKFYKRVYTIIGLGVAVIGLILVPFLKYLINLDVEIPNVEIYYLLYLADTVASYMLANRVAIINADQKMYIIKKYTIFFKILQAIIQIIVLVIFKNFLLYLIIQVLCTFLTNLYGAKKAKNMYPYISEKSRYLEKTEKKEIFSNVKSMFIYKIGGVILNNTDNILISILAGTVMVGYYANYTMIINAVTLFMSIIFSAMTASVGNLNTENDSKKQEDVLNRIDFIAQWGYGFCTICLFVLCNDFITIIWGEQYVLNILVLIAALLNFYLVGNLQAMQLYRNTTGMFKEVKYIFIFTSIINIIISILLGSIFKDEQMKLFGIIIATAIARILTNVWYEPVKTYNLFFKISSKGYFVKKTYNFIIMVITLLITNYLCSLFNEINILTFIFKCFICITVPNILYLLVYFRNDNFKYYIQLIKEIYIKKIKKQGSVTN